MDENHPSYRQELMISPPKCSSRWAITHLLRSGMKLRFACRPVNRKWILSGDSTELTLVEEQELPLITKSIHIKIHKIISTDIMEVMMDGIMHELVGFSLLFTKRSELMTIVAATVASTILGKSSVRPFGHNHWDLDFDFTVFNGYVYGHRPPIQAVLATTDASIESLESVRIRLSKRDCKSCTICLEDFVDGCEGVCMPCSHVFHGICIRKWLRNSYFCPLCRYEMPIE